MPRHYTHVGELAASQAVAALPAFLGEPEDSKSTSTPVSRLDTFILMEETLAKMTARTWNRDRKRLLAFVGRAKQGK